MNIKEYIMVGLLCVLCTLNYIEITKLQDKLNQPNFGSINSDYFSQFGVLRDELARLNYNQQQSLLSLSDLYTGYHMLSDSYDELVSEQRGSSK